MICKARCFLILLIVLLFGISCVSAPKSSEENKKQNKSGSKSEKTDDTDGKTEKKYDGNKNSESEEKGKDLPDESKEKKIKEEKELKYYDGLKYSGPAERKFNDGLGRYFTDGCSEAIEIWKEALEKDKARYQIAFNIALCYQRLNNEKDSREWFERAYLINPEFTKPLYNLVVMIGMKIQSEKSYFLKMIEKTEDEVEKNNFISWLYIQCGDLDLAEKHAKMVLKLDEQNSEAVISLATVYYTKKMYELTLIALTTAEKWDSENFELHRLFGFLLYDMGDKKNATVHLQKAIKINPELPEVRNILAVLAMEIEDFASAKEHLEAALKIVPDFKQAKINLAIAFKGLSDFKKSKEILTDLEKDKSVDSEMMKSVLFNLGILYLDSDVDGDKNPERFDVAANYFNRYLKAVAKDSNFKKDKALVDGYIKESVTEKQKLKFYVASKARAEKRKKEIEEEQKQFLLNKEMAFEKAMKEDKVETWKLFLKDFPLIDENDKMGLAATARFEELNKPSGEAPADGGGEKTE